jgi:uroporphyrinogen-III synthase
MFMGNSALAGKRLLVIRSHRRQDDFLDLLKDMDCDVLHKPILDLKPVNNIETIKKQISNFDEFDIAIFVSFHAAHIAFDWLDKYWPMLPLGIDYLAIGRQTATVIKELGLPVSWPSSNATSDGLLSLAGLQNIESKRVIIFRGSTGRDDLQLGLSQRGAKVEYCNLYDRILNTKQRTSILNELSTVDCMIAHSGELLEALGARNDIEEFTKGNNFSLLVPSQRVADIGVKLGYSSIVVADSALPEVMFSALGKSFSST